MLFSCLIKAAVGKIFTFFFQSEAHLVIKNVVMPSLPVLVMCRKCSKLALNTSFMVFVVVKSKKKIHYYMLHNRPTQSERTKM